MKPTISLALLGLLAIVVSVSEAAPRSSCPPGWFFYKANCYGYFRFRLSWSEAEFECASYGHGAHLASILDDAEASIIGSHVGAYANTVHIWIGLHDPEQNRRWKWADGSMYNYRSWKSGEPNNLQGVEYCGELTKDTNYNQWNDTPCTKQNNFVCKYKPGGNILPFTTRSNSEELSQIPHRLTDPLPKTVRILGRSKKIR